MVGRALGRSSEARRGTDHRALERVIVGSAMLVDSMLLTVVDPPLVEVTLLTLVDPALVDSVVALGSATLVVSVGTGPEVP